MKYINNNTNSNNNKFKTLKNLFDYFFIYISLLYKISI